LRHANTKPSKSSDQIRTDWPKVAPRNRSCVGKLALRIRSEVAGVEAKDLATYLPEHLWQKSQVLAARIEKAKQSSLGLAVSKLGRDLKYSIDCLHQCLKRISDQVHETAAARQFASPSELYSDLVALQAEFDELEWDLSARTVSVTTEPIVLDDIDLGSFEIRLHWDRLHVYQPYEVIALQPNPSCLNESVTHPHVQDEALCEGEGARSIERSFTEGRLFDFFLLVRGVLTTYNSSSAYVSLQRWSGRVCPDCDVDGEQASSVFFSYRGPFNTRRFPGAVVPGAQTVPPPGRRVR
jgi:hypothetical protein